MKALVTGGTGFVGASLVRELIAQSWEVRALVRKESPGGNLEGLEVERIQGDLLDPTSLEKAMKGCDALFHCAAHYALWTPKPDLLYESNVTGTANILEVAGNLGIERIVYTSTVAAVGRPENGSLGTEEHFVNPDKAVGHYKRSKVLAEQKVREAAGNGLPVITVNPSAPVGPFDIKPTPTGQMILDFVRGKVPAYMDTGLNLVDVRDVARGHILALEKGRPGERYILANRNMTLKEIFDLLGTLTGIPSPRVRLPYFVALAAAFFDEAITGRVLGRTPRVTVSGVRMTKNKMWYDASKAIRELGFRQSPVEQALRDAVDWFRQNGYAN
ncbi:MAG: NAD-dependent epimerase/dehydratase family protein [Planctomycetota bacterium]|nr:NAD-dependent epimerase/dehydratase family protein [Planctomycetota bacterium]